ncbi:MAG: CaiB/BaiF CoA-transferase family protein, partial [Betaproteobacteria bacterium]
MGPLKGMKIIELAGIGPGPMCAMLLADLGATVLRIERKEPVDLGNPRPLKFNLLLRNRKSIALDLKAPAAVELVLRLVTDADALLEGFRPGVAERLGLGPDACSARNPRLVYGRMTGWGQTGPLASAAGHDLNYIALTGALASIGRKGQPPTPPLNLLGDYAGGSLYLAMGMLAAVIEARQSGQGQVVDAAIVDGTASLMTSVFGLYAAGLMSLERGTNTSDSGAYFYDVYECADGRWVSVAPIEARFHAQFLEL